MIFKICLLALACGLVYLTYRCVFGGGESGKEKSSKGQVHLATSTERNLSNPHGEPARVALFRLFISPNGTTATVPDASDVDSRSDAGVQIDDKSEEAATVPPKRAEVTALPKRVARTKSSSSSAEEGGPSPFILRKRRRFNHQ